MSIIIFIIVLAILVFVHELGHFLVAKRSGIKVTEFGIGFPPKLWSTTRGETEYSINAIPFGGFVKIFGEDPNDESISGPEHNRSIIAKPRHIQAAVLVAGVLFNFLFAWILIASGYLIGLPTPVSHDGPGIVKNERLIITAVSPNSPADRSSIKPGDTIISLSSESSRETFVLKEMTGRNVSNFIEAHGKDGVKFEIKRGKELLIKDVKGEEGVIQGKIAIGIAMDEIGILNLPVHLALVEGLKDTSQLFVATTVGLVNFLGQAVVGNGDFSQVTGPVGIVGLVGDVSELGLVYLISFTALISINLAVINLLPFPALDGGRLVIVAIEAVRKKAISSKITNTVNAVGFAFLILLMVVVTFHDIIKLF